MTFERETSAMRYRLEMLKKSVRSVFALLPCSRTKRMLRSLKRLRPWDTSEKIGVFKHSLPFVMGSSPEAGICYRSQLINSPRFAATLISVSLLLILGCATTYHYDWAPQEILAKVDAGLTFDQIKAAPDSHIGSTLILGGEVLEAKRMTDYTRLVILQLPLEDGVEPVIDRMQSKGRFIALEHDFLDPAIVPPGTRLTIIGTISGKHIEPLGEMEYTYPTVTIDHLKVWPKPMDYPYGPYPYRYRPYGYGPYFWNPYYYSPYYYW